MRKWNAAIIGMGFIGRHHFDALLRLPHIRVTAICVHKKEDIQRVREEFGVEKVTDDWREIMADPTIDVIHNCTPNHVHQAVNMAAIAAGKHIYAEKPLGLDGKEAYEVWQAAKAAGIGNGVNYPCRNHAALQEMRSRIRRGLGGRTLYVGGCFLQDSVARHTDYTPRRIPETSPARALLDIGVHWADTAMFVAGQPIKRVYARMYTHYPVRIDPATGREIQVRSDDTTSVMVEFEDGTPGSALFSKCMLGHKNDLQVVVSGEQCEYTWKQEQCDRLFVGNREIGNETVFMSNEFSAPEVLPYITMPAGHVMGWIEAQRNAFVGFYNSLEDGSFVNQDQPYATFREGWLGNRFVEACLQSQQEDRWIEL